MATPLFFNCSLHFSAAKIQFTIN